MITVALQGAEFFAYHGYYPEEQLLGSKFITDIEVQFNADGKLDTDDMRYTVNYEQLHRIAESEMKVPRKLIETVAQAIVSRIAESFQFIESATVTIKKPNPPLKGQVNYSSIQISYQKTDKPNDL